MLRPQTLSQKNIKALVEINGPTQTRICVYAARQPDLMRRLKDLKQFSPVGLSQSRGQKGLFLSFDHVAPLTGGARAQTRSIRPRVNRRPTCHATRRKLIRMKKLRATLKGRRDIGPLLGLVPGSHLNVLRRDPFRTHGRKR